MAEKKLSLVQQENLSVLIRQYPVIFDKSHKATKRETLHVFAFKTQLRFYFNF